MRRAKRPSLENKCNRCHAVQTREIEATVKSEKMKGPDMSNVGSERDAAWIQRVRDEGSKAPRQETQANYKGSKNGLAEIAQLARHTQQVKATEYSRKEPWLRRRRMARK